MAPVYTITTPTFLKRVTRWLNVTKLTEKQTVNYRRAHYRIVDQAVTDGKIPYEFASFCKK